MGEIKRVLMYQPESAGGNFEFALIPRQGLLVLSAALKQWNERGDAPFLYDPEILFEERIGKINPAKDLQDVDILMITALINEASEAYRIAREAREHYPNLVIIGGGPQMSPLPEEAIRLGRFDVIVEREGEDIIGALCDVCMAYNGMERKQFLGKVPGIFFEEEGGIQYVPRPPGKRVIRADFVQLLDYKAIRGLSSATPMMGGVLETVRGCTEKCTYCQVIKQFLSYRFVTEEIQLKRIGQLHELVVSGLVHSARGQSSIFISDDLHIPPLIAKSFRGMRLKMLRRWKDHTEGLNFTCQVRAEIGQDEEIIDAMLECGFRMLYIGVESNNLGNLEAVRKRQNPEQVYRDLTRLRERGFKLVGMTIIGLPFDTEESIIEMANWVTELTDFQTMNWLTPLPATSNWLGLKPLDAQGNVLPTDKDGNVSSEIGMRPYSLYTGEQLVTYDERWSMAESRELGRRYYSKLKPVDRYYARIFNMSVKLHASRWAQEIASRFRGIVSPELVNRIELTLQRPSAPSLGELWSQVSTATAHLYNAHVAECLNLLKSYHKLFGYTSV